MIAASRRDALGQKGALLRSLFIVFLRYFDTVLRALVRPPSVDNYIYLLSGSASNTLVPIAMIDAFRISLMISGFRSSAMLACYCKKLFHCTYPTLLSTGARRQSISVAVRLTQREMNDG